MYPHTLTGIFASKSADTIRKNAILLPAYTLLLGLIALMGYMAYAANIKVTSNNDVVPMLFKVLFPSWFAGFAFAAIAIGALVPAAVMSIGAANLFTRNVWKSYVDPGISHAGETTVAKIASLVVKLGALAFTIFLPTQYALDLQLLGGLWILQTFPALVFGLFTRWFRAEGLLLGWAVGILWGSWTAWSNGLKPLATIDLGGASYVFYVGLGALILNIAVAALVTLILAWMRPEPRASVIARS
jgi:SSS family solute:Na+ symporter